MIDKPMLAAKVKQLEDLRFPLLCTPKVDGIRCLLIDGRAWTRAFKRVPNVHVRRTLSSLPDGLDGELIVPGEDQFQATTSGIMTGGGEPAFEYMVFDDFSNTLLPYELRVKQLIARIPELPWLRVLEPTLIANLDEFLAYEEACLAEGYEGVCGRCPGSPYKEGRSSLREHYLVKFKRLEDSEARITGFKEGLENLNPQKPNNFGRMGRPGGKAMKVPKGTLGAFLCVDLTTGVELSIGGGVGLTHALRAKVWADRASYVGRIIRYKYQSVGVKEKPRFPKFAGFRDEADL